MNILKPKKSKFDEDLASRINEEKIELERHEYQALKEVYALFGEEPDFEKEHLRIVIKEGHLHYLNLCDRGLSSLPESVGNWTRIQTICIQSNKLSSLPDSVGSWRNLQGIDFWNNRLVSLPKSVENWTYLDSIRLDLNKIKSLPECVGNWKNLKEISLGGNPQLTNLPDSVVNWKNLQSIELKYTPIAQNQEYISELERKFPNAKIVTK